MAAGDQYNKTTLGTSAGKTNMSRPMGSSGTSIKKGGDPSLSQIATGIMGRAKQNEAEAAQEKRLADDLRQARIDAFKSQAEKDKGKPKPLGSSPPPVATTTLFADLTQPTLTPAGTAAVAIGSGETAANNYTPQPRQEAPADRVYPTDPVLPDPDAPPAPTEGRLEPKRTALARPPDFVAGPNKEMTGMSAGRPTYTSVDELYGKGETPIANTIRNTPATADPNKPVMIEGQTIEQRRADYQKRSQSGQPQKGRPSAEKPAAKPERDPVKEYEDSLKDYQASFNSGDSDQTFTDKKNKPQEIYNAASSLEQAKITANSLKRAAPLAQRDSALLRDALQEQRKQRDTVPNKAAKPKQSSFKK